MADKEIQVLMLKGQQGDRGSSITSIEKTSTSGNVDTYTIYLSDGTTTTFQVTNGEVTEQELTNAVNGLQSSIDSLDGRTTTNTNNIATNTNNIATNTSNISKNTTDIATNTGDILNIKDGVALYRHDIKISNITEGEIYFSLYLSTSDPITSGFTIKDIIGLGNEISVNGKVSYNSSSSESTYRPLYKMKLIDTNPDGVLNYLFNFGFYFVRTGSETTNYRSFTYYTNTTEQNEPIKPTDTVTKIFDLSDLIVVDNPTYTSQFEYEDGGWDYNSVHVTNPNSEAGTLYYNINDGTYTNVSIDANETVNIGTYRAGTSGNIYLIVNGKTSDVVSWIA